MWMPRIPIDSGASERSPLEKHYSQTRSDADGCGSRNGASEALVRKSLILGFFQGGDMWTCDYRDANDGKALEGTFRFVHKLIHSGRLSVEEMEFSRLSAGEVGGIRWLSTPFRENYSQRFVLMTRGLRRNAGAWRIAGKKS